MNCVVTAGPTFEPLDDVRRLTNFSTGRLGTELANYLVESGHTVTLLLGQGATHPGPRLAQMVEPFTTTADLQQRLQSLAGADPDAVFHAAAVSDFRFGKIWSRSDSGPLTEVQAGKVSSRQEGLLAELVPTPKLIAQLRGWFPRARLIGWKYEVDGGINDALERGARQMRDCQTNACVVNGPAYGEGFGLLTNAAPSLHLVNELELFPALERLAAQLV